MNALKKISTVGNKTIPLSLWNAYSDLKSKTSLRLRNISSGVDNITLKLFEENIGKSLNQISTSLRSSNGYTFSPLKTVLIPKPNGKDRLICIPTISDRIVQKSILKHLSINNIHAKFNGVSYGFIKNKSTKDAVRDAIKKRNEKPFSYKTDISSFFDTIDRTILQRLITNRIKEKSLHDILIKALNCEIEYTDETKWRRIKRIGIKPGLGVRQGMPLSPFFANLILNDFDKQVLRNNYSMIRYADDLIFFANTRNECMEIHNHCLNELKRINLSIHDIGEPNTKTKIYEPSEMVEFLGVGIEFFNGKYRTIITDTQKIKIRDSIFLYSDINYLIDKNITLSTFAKKMQAIYNGYSEAYSICDDEVFTEFQKSLNQWINSAKYHLFNKGLGINLRKLNNKQLSFLDVDIRL